MIRPRAMRRGWALAVMGFVTAMAAALAPPSSRAATLLVVCQAGAELQVRDLPGLTIRHRIPLPKGPASVAVSLDQAWAYVTHPDAGRVSRIHLADGRLDGANAIGGQPFGIAADPDGQTLYVSDWSADSVRRLDAVSLAPTGSVKVGHAPAGLALDPQRRRLFSADREAGAVSIIELGSFERVASVPVGEGPYAFDTQWDPQALRLVTVRAGQLIEIDPRTLEVTRTEVGKMPYGVARAAGSGDVIVANQQSGTVSLVAPPMQGQPDRAVRTLRVGGSPEGVAADPDRPHAYVSDWFGDQLLDLDLATFTVAARAPTCKGPRAVRVVP